MSSWTEGSGKYANGIHDVFGWKDWHFSESILGNPRTAETINYRLVGNQKTNVDAMTILAHSSSIFDRG
ncbi:hypothetical protein [Sphingobacterium sp.]|uniref:hypothetical protein n=1 Tax=Sphingobacterium sp. TaxID=341027 RepID=UPI0028B0EA8A|nr:hypothetical protein [Sphingobacterium sp.]